MRVSTKDQAREGFSLPEQIAVVLTNNFFTSSAKELAKKNNVLLWDRNKLKELINNLHEHKK